MKHVFETSEEAYARQDPCGEPILDAVVDALRKTRIHTAVDLALFLGVEMRDLDGAIHLLTGMYTGELVTSWRVTQAWDMISQLIHPSDPSQVTLSLRTLPKDELRKIALRCGWGDEKAMIRYLKAHRPSPDTQRASDK